MSQFKLISSLSSPLILSLLLALTNQQLVAVNAQFDKDYSCSISRDQAWDNKCDTLRDGVCDDPGLGGSDEECRNQDCVDCNKMCRQFDDDCGSCLKAQGCYYCPEDGTCDNIAGYTSSNKVRNCRFKSDYLSSLNGDTPDSCVQDDFYSKDPQLGGSNWMFDMINLIDVWDTYGLTGNGVTIRINDDGVYVDNKEFDGRFDDVSNSCPSYKPEPNDPDKDHGTAVAGIIVGNANNNLCSAGIASQAKISSCNFFRDDWNFGQLAFKLETFDISQNSIGMPACTENGDFPEEDNIVYDSGCPFQYSDSEHNPCDFCYGEFTAGSRSLSVDCGNAIVKHCQKYYKEDSDACSDFPDLVIGGSCDFSKAPAPARLAIEQGIKDGRDGKGTIFTFAAGNSFETGDDVNFSGWTNSRYTISVGAVGKDGYHAAYSTSGAALMVSAPSGDEKDIGHLSTAGLGVETCADSGQGTSFACPVVSGVVALMLEANPELTWRDVQAIIAESSTRVESDDEDDTQTTNSAGIWHSNWYGFGIINAKKAVDAALEWQTLTEELQAIGMSREENKELTDNDGNQFTSSIDMDPTDDKYPDDFVAESIVVLLDLSHYNRGDLEIELESPSGVKSILVPGKRPENIQLEGEERWKLMTLKNWGEDPTGTWKLTVRDLVDREDSSDKNIFRNWQIIVYGRSVSGQEGFGVPENENETDPPKNEFCLNRDNPPSCVNSDGVVSCPVYNVLSDSEKSIFLDSRLICPSDVLASENLSLTEASSRGLCSCEANIFDAENCDTVEEDLECQCYTCDSGVMAFSCNKPIIDDCFSLSCEGECNGDFNMPLVVAPTFKPTENPTRSPTKKPTDGPTKNPTISPTRNPTKSPTKKPSDGPSKKPTESPTRNPTVSPTFNPTKKPTESPTSKPTLNSVPEVEVIFSPPTSEPTTIAGQITEEDLQSEFEEGDEDEDEDEDSVEENPEIPEEAFGDRNLSCENAEQISSSTTPVEGTISSLPLVGFEGTCLSGLETVGGWYEITGNGNIFTLTACSLEPSKSVGISVFTGSCNRSKCIEHQSRQIAACENGNGHAASFTSEPGTVYNILISGIPVGAPLPGGSDSSTSSEKERQERRHLQTTDFQLDVSETEAPNNSKCASALPAKFNKAVEGHTMGLLPTFRTCQNTDRSGAWYTIEGSQPQDLDGIIVYEANTCNQDSNFYNTISVFRGNSCGEHKCVDVDVLPCQNGWFGEQVFWSTTVKESYQIFVHSSDTLEAQTYSAGTFRMDLQYHKRLENDQCNAANLVELNREESIKSTTSGAKPDMNAIENSSCGIGNAGAWYKIKGTGGILQASTCSGETDHKTAIQVFSGQCGLLSCIASAGGNKALCGDGKGSVVNFKTQESVDYFILVSGRREGQTGNFRLQIMEEDPVGNNECRKAPALSKGVSVDGSTLQATVDFPQDESCVVPLDTPGVWYTIEGAGKAIEVSTCQNNQFDSAISIFEGSCPRSLKCVAGSSAIDPKCTNGKGVATSFFGEKGKKYLAYVHGASGSPNHMGDFSLSYSEFEITESNEFCPMAREVPTDGTRVQGSTQDSTIASIPVSSCGVEITEPGLWYTFKGTGQPFEITACSEDEGDFDVSVSIFEGGPGGCDALTCLSGTTFVETCSSLQERRSLMQSISSAFRFMSKPGTDYYAFVHGTDVGDFTLYIQDEDIDGFGTAAPTETPMKHGKDLFRWIPINTRTLVIATDYFDLDFISEPSEGNATIAGYQIKYTPPADFVGDVTMRLDGCNDGDCYRFDISVHVMGEKIDPTSAAANEGWNKWWLLLLLLLVIIPCICLPFYLFFRNKNRPVVEDSEDDLSDGFDDDPFNRDPKGSLLSGRRSSRRGMGDSRMGDSSGDDWESSDDDDDDVSYDSRDKESDSDEDTDSRPNGATSVDDSDDGFADGFSSDGFNDEFSGSRGYHG